MGLKITPTNAAYSKQGYYLNRTALAELELPANTTSFKRYDEERPVLGIVADFNFNSLYQKIGSVMIAQMDDNKMPWKVFVKLSGGNLIETVDKIKKEQSRFTGGVPMESGFVDDTINQWYQKEEKTASIVGAFTLLAITYLSFKEGVDSRVPRSFSVAPLLYILAVSNSTLSLSPVPEAKYSNCSSESVAFV